MSEEQKTEEAKSVKFEIELHQDGQLSVKCPALLDTMFCLGLLEMAKAVVFQHKANQAQIVKPKPGGIIDFARKRFK